MKKFKLEARPQHLLKLAITSVTFKKEHIKLKQRD